MNRRTFIQNSAVGATATLFSPYGIAAPRATKYRTALIGTGWWGMNILGAAMAAGQSKVVAMCDVDENQISKAAAEVEKPSGRGEIGASKKCRNHLLMCCRKTMIPQI